MKKYSKYIIWGVIGILVLLIIVQVKKNTTPATAASSPPGSPVFSTGQTTAGTDAGFDNWLNTTIANDTTKIASLSKV